MKLAEQLEKSVLRFAMEGKITKLNEYTENAQDLINSISKIKKDKISSGEIKKTRGLTPLDVDEIPFGIPDHWVWTKLGDIAEFRIGKTPPRSNGRLWGDYFPWVSIADINSGKIETTKERVSEKAIIENFKNNISKKGTLIMSFKLSIGKTAILDVDAVHNEAIISIYPYLDENNILRDYLKTFLPVISIEGDTKSAVKGATLNSTSLANLMVPLPPFKEQSDIVKKVNNLMKQINELKEQENLLLDLDQQLPTRLRRSVLQSSMMGNLTEQIESKQTGKDVLNEAIKTKEELIKNKVVRRVRVPEVVEENIPFDIPESWTWGYIEDISYSLSPRKYQIKSSEVEMKGKYPVVSQSKEFIDGYYSDESKLFKSESPTIVFGDHNKTVKFIDFDFIVGADGTKLLKPLINPNYYYYVIQYIVQGLDTKNYGRHYNLLTKEPIPIPPLEEQQRIVDKLDQLFAEIDLLESNE